MGRRIADCPFPIAPFQPPIVLQEAPIAQIVSQAETIAHRPFPIANCLAGRERSSVGSSARLPGSEPSLRGNWKWAMGDDYLDQGFGSVVLVILVNSFNNALQSSKIELCSLSSRNSL